MLSLRKVVLKFLTLTCCCLLLIACSKVTQENFNKIQPGMSLKEVKTILGEPSNSQSVDIAGVSGTSSTWKNNTDEININFLGDQVLVKTYNKAVNLKEKD